MTRYGPTDGLRPEPLGRGDGLTLRGADAAISAVCEVVSPATGVVSE